MKKKIKGWITIIIKHWIKIESMVHHTQWEVEIEEERGRENSYI